MPKFTATTTINTGSETVSATTAGDFVELFRVKQTVDNADGFINIASGHADKAAATLNDCKAMIVKNIGKVAAEIQTSSYAVAHAAPDTTSSNIQYLSRLLRVGEYLYFPNWRQFNINADASGANGFTLNNQVPNSNMYVALNNAAAGDAQLINGSELASDAAVTAVVVDEGGYFFVGDLVRFENEICEVTAISSNTLTIIRGMHGSTAATHADDVAVRLPFFNAHKNFSAATGGYDTVQTTSGGLFRCQNFVGFGRNTDGSNNRESNGIVPSSVSGKFYSSGYQDMNMTNITSSTHSGLTASTVYNLDITVDGGTKFHDISITTDSSNLNFGGTNGVIAKLQAALDAQYYTTGNLFEKKVHVGIHNGDLRFTSGSHLSTSAILIEDTGASGSLIEATAFSRFPNAAKIGDPVAAALPPDTIVNPKTGIEEANVGAMFYDDGHGNIHGTCSGTINYESGALDLRGCPPDAHFVVSANYGSAHAGGNRFSNTTGNSIAALAARSMNSKIDTTIEVVGLK